MKLSVWAGRAQLRNPEKWIDEIQKAGCTRLDLCINDMSRWRARENGSVTNGWYRSTTHWQTYDVAKLERFGRLAVDAGLELHTLFWAVPTKKSFISAACWLHTYAETVGASGHVLDAEGPITHSSFVDYGGSPRRAAEHLSSMMRQPLGVTHIGYAPEHSVGPFVQVASYAIPQTYMTTTSGLTEDSVARLVGRSCTRLGAQHIVGSFALYRQPNPSYVQTTLDALQACNVSVAVGWHASNMKQHVNVLRRNTDEPNY